MQQGMIEVRAEEANGQPPPLIDATDDEAQVDLAQSGSGRHSRARTKDFLVQNSEREQMDLWEARDAI